MSWIRSCIQHRWAKFKGNTHGQCGQAGAAGKRHVKDLGLMAMAYGHVYVAQIAMGANLGQTLKAMVEAENYPGPSLIIAYAPCISHGIKTGMGTSIREKKGLWKPDIGISIVLIGFAPGRQEPLILDSKPPKQILNSFCKVKSAMPS